MSNKDYEDYDDELGGDYSLDYGYLEDMDEDGNELDNLNGPSDETMDENDIPYGFSVEEDDDDRDLDNGYAEDLDKDGNELENPNEIYDEVDLCYDYNDF